MNSEKYSLLLSFLFLLSSCATLKPPEDFKSNIQHSNLKDLEGLYENFGNPSYQSFWENICSSKVKIADTTSSFELKFISNDKVQFNLYSSYDKLETKVLKYKFKNGGLYIPGSYNYRYQGLPLIFYRAASEALWISKDNENELYLKFDGSASGGLLFLIFGAPIKGEARFNKI